MIDSSRKRLPPDARKAEILSAALRLLAHKGLRGFSLEAVAREAGVAASLPRHYFGGIDDLMKAVTEDVLREVEETFIGSDSGMSIEERFAAYLNVLDRNPWGHDVWMRAADVHPDVDNIVRRSRQRMIETIYRRPWAALSRREQIDGRGRIGHIESVVCEWLENDKTDRDLTVEVLVQAVKQSLPIHRQARQFNGAREAVAI